MRILALLAGLMAAAGPVAAVGYSGTAGSFHTLTLPGSDCGGDPGCAQVGGGAAPSLWVDDDLAFANLCLHGIDQNNGQPSGIAGGQVGHFGAQGATFLATAQGGCAFLDAEHGNANADTDGGQAHAAEPLGVAPHGGGNHAHADADGGSKRVHADASGNALGGPTGGNHADARADVRGDSVGNPGQGPPASACAWGFASFPQSVVGGQAFNAAVNDQCPPPPPDCSDGIDNDGDGLADYPADPGCNAPWDMTELHDCSDGLDNDHDGAVDWPDEVHCTGPDDPTEAPQCSNAIDDDGDGWVDGKDPQCSSFEDDDEAN